MTSGGNAAKLCCTCHEWKPLTEFNKRASSPDGLQARCRACARRWYETNKVKHKANTYSRTKTVRREYSELMRKYLLEHPCVDCGEPDLRVLEFDHRPGENKELEVAELVRSLTTWKRIEREIAKCDVRCANCHRIVTCERAGNWRERAEKIRRRHSNRHSERWAVPELNRQPED